MPETWNSLPLHLHSPTISRIELKSHLFKCTYTWLHLRELLRSELTYFTNCARYANCVTLRRQSCDPEEFCSSILKISVSWKETFVAVGPSLNTETEGIKVIMTTATHWRIMSTASSYGNPSSISANATITGALQRASHMPCYTNMLR